jgi:hypothetical protein
MILIMIMSFIFIVSVIIKAVAPQHNTTHSFLHNHSSWRKSPVEIVATNSRTHRATTAIAAAVAEMCASATDAAVVLAKERRDDARRRQTTTDRRRQTATRGRRADFPGVRG